MLPYPFCLLGVKIESILGKEFTSLPAYIPLDNKREFSTQQEFQKEVEQILSEQGKIWAVSGYLENRASLLKDCPQMVNKQRFFHLGLDITAPLGTQLHAPLNCEVVGSEYEQGNGNYGGLVVLKCQENETVFYLLFGHLNTDKLPEINTKFNAGEVFAELGDFSQNGNWFYHTHLQVLTEKAFAQGWINKGYCAAADIPEIDNFCPNPYYLLR